MEIDTVIKSDGQMATHEEIAEIMGLLAPMFTATPEA
jgi:hypothetical protein